MLQREKMIADIRKGLAVYQDYIRPGGTMNLTDTNIYAENFVAGLLNAIHGWNLVSTNQAKANYPCIDLIDKRLGLGVQVTVETGSGKLNKTIECANNHELAGKIKHIRVFLLVPKQRRYVIRAECPGVEFKWQKDVLDFDDAVKSAHAISDLEQLDRVHRHIVDSMPSIFPEYSNLLPVHLPTTDPARAWLAFSSRATNLVGRDKEQADLLEFLNSESKFSWLLMTGDAGSGKSRLALELCRQVEGEWHAGFLTGTEKDFKWSNFSPLRKSLIVIDYVASRAVEVGEIVLTLSRASSSFTRPVRILLVEREKSSWWATFSREDSQSESAEIIACQFGDPLDLPGMSLEAILKIAKEVVDSRKGKWNEEVAGEFLSEMFRYDRRCRPLFAMIVALYLEALEIDQVEPNLLEVVLNREAARRRLLLPNSDELTRMEYLLLLATIVGGLVPKDGSFDHLAMSMVAGLLPNVGLLDQTLYNDFACSAGGAGTTLAGLQPDILGERFLLDRISKPGISGQNARALLLAAWSWQPNDVRVVALRCSLDFPEDRALDTLYDLPLDTEESRRYWAEMVADLMPYGDEFYDASAKQKLKKLIPLADSHPQERELQEATARADYNHALPYMFRDNHFAIKQFDAAIARAGQDSLIAKMAMHNRVIVQRSADSIYNPFEVFSMVIETHDAPDELRACAFNNRADLYVDLEEHDQAIRDRSEVLALKDTSHDRRFIALFRRSRSYAVRGNVQAALDDLSRILEIWDITPHQKADARLERATIMRHLERWDEARTDLEAVVASKYLFEGRRATALVELSEMSRRTGDPGQAVSLLSQALDDPEISDETWIDAKIVGGMLMEDSDDLKGAYEVWRQVLATPSASEHQVSLARRRIDEISKGTSALGQRDS